MSGRWSRRQSQQKYHVVLPSWRSTADIVWTRAPEFCWDPLPEVALPVSRHRLDRVALHEWAIGYGRAVRLREIYANERVARP